jgi:hypothetical protein
VTNPAVFCSRRRPKLRIPAGDEARAADNFLQKQQKQRKE